MNMRFTSPLWPLVPSLNFKKMRVGEIYEAGGGARCSRNSRPQEH